MAIETIYTYSQGLENSSLQTQKVLFTAFFKRKKINTSVGLTHVGIGVDLGASSAGAVSTIIKRVGFYNDNNQFIEAEYSGQLPNEMSLDRVVYVTYALGGYQCVVYSVICIRIFETAMAAKSGVAHFDVGGQAYYEASTGRVFGAHHVVELEQGAATPALLRRVFAASRRDAAAAAGLPLANT